MRDFSAIVNGYEKEKDRLEAKKAESDQSSRKDFDRLVQLAADLGLTSTRVLHRAVDDAMAGLKVAANYSIKSQIAFLIESEFNPEEIEKCLRNP